MTFLLTIINVIDFLNSNYLNYYIKFIRFKAVPSNQNRDNFIDKAFTVIAESIVKIMPIAEKEKMAYIYYRDGLAAQNNGDYSEALDYYKESLLLEENKIDRGETLKNCSFIGELGLSGQVRQANNLRAKIDEAIRLGFKNILIPKTTCEIKVYYQNLIDIIEITNIKEAMNYVLRE